MDTNKLPDHRKIGRDLDLFVFSDLVGPGLPLFTPKGTIIRQELENFVKSLQEKHGYQPVLIPHLAKKELYETSGHWAKYKENMFHVLNENKEKWVVKPMNCPHHIQIYASRPRSYRELPQRYSEVTAVYRNEKPGELLGLTRVYMLTQDDAHVFCTEEQAVEECLKVYDIIKNFYSVFGMDVGKKARMSLRDPQHPEKYLGDDKLWEKSENMMRDVAKKAGLETYDGIGEAAFYAPKLDFMAYDSLDREWQLATIQLDLNFPDRFGLTYIDKDGSNKKPIMIHRAILGSVERFISILLEHFNGALPTWLSPIQVKVLPITERNLDYANQVTKLLSDQAIRVEVDDRNETLQAKIRDAQLQKIPYMLIIGDKEEKENTVSERGRSGKDYGAQPLEEFIKNVKKEIETKSLD